MSSANAFSGSRFAGSTVMLSVPRSEADGFWVWPFMITRPLLIQSCKRERLYWGSFSCRKISSRFPASCCETLNCKLMTRSTRLILLLLFLTVAMARFCHTQILWVEEAYPSAAAAQVMEGKFLYRDVWFDKPPLYAL